MICLNALRFPSRIINPSQLVFWSPYRHRFQRSNWLRLIKVAVEIVLCAMLIFSDNSMMLQNGADWLCVQACTMYLLSTRMSLTDDVANWMDEKWFSDQFNWLVAWASQFELIILYFALSSISSRLHSVVRRLLQVSSRNFNYAWTFNYVFSSRWHQFFETSVHIFSLWDKTISLSTLKP